jgi:outer membrane protein OmpA-like peptidoglycan-associated protein
MENVSSTARQGWLTGAHAKARTAMLVAGIVAVVAAAGAATHWVHIQELDAANSGELPAQTETPMRVRIVPPPPVVTAAHGGEAVHTDVYFDLKSTRLRADAVRVLQEQAAQMDRESPWVVLVQGYTDRQGSPEYNKQLAQRRAEAVKQFMVELGVPESSVRTVTLGPDGALCDEPTRECQQLNRRVHIEMRKLTRATPAAATPGQVFEAAPSGGQLEGGK